MVGFDIHVDATELSLAAETFLIDKLGFWRSDFCGHPEGAEAYEPPHHLTLKPKNSGVYRTVFNRIRDYFQAHPGCINGYIEGEFFAFDKNVPSKPYNEEIALPFRVKTSFLPPGTFRESEIHVALSKADSDPRLLRTLMQMGLFSAYLSKSYGIGQVFTVQGTRAIIETLLPRLFKFLERAGGTSRCSVKEERVIGYWMSAPDVALPPVVKEVIWD